METMKVRNFSNNFAFAPQSIFLPRASGYVVCVLSRLGVLGVIPLPSSIVTN